MNSSALTARVAAEIDAANLPAAAKSQLRKCLVTLSATLDTVRQADPIELLGQIVVAAVTPRAGMVLAAESWAAVVDAKALAMTRPEVLAALVEAVEADHPAAVDVVLAATTLLLGRSGRDSYASEARRLLRSGRLPVLVALASREGDQVASLLTVASLGDEMAETMH